MILHVSSTSLLKTLWEKEKLLIMSNFSFSHCVFYPFRELSAIFMKYEYVVCKPFQFRRVQNLPFGKELNRFQNVVCHKNRKISKTLWEKENILVTRVFFFSCNVFCPSQNKFQFWGPIHFFVGELFQFGLIYMFVVLLRVKRLKSLWLLISEQ